MFILLKLLWNLCLEKKVEQRSLDKKLLSTSCVICVLWIFWWSSKSDQAAPLLYFLILSLHISLPSLSRLLTSVLFGAQHPRWHRSVTRRSNWGSTTWKGPTRLSHQQNPESRGRTGSTTIITTTAAIDAGTRTKTENRSPWIELRQCNHPVLLVRISFTACFVTHWSTQFWPYSCWINLKI